MADAILTDEPTVAAAAGRGPCLLIGGTADKVWDGRLARSLTPHVLKIDRADHGMLAPDTCRSPPRFWAR